MILTKYKQYILLKLCVCVCVCVCVYIYIYILEIAKNYTVYNFHKASISSKWIYYTIFLKGTQIISFLRRNYGSEDLRKMTKSEWKRNVENDAVLFHFFSLQCRFSLNQGRRTSKAFHKWCQVISTELKPPGSGEILKVPGP